MEETITQEKRGPGRPPKGAGRKPFGGVTQRLAYPQRPNYHRHWFNDVPGRIQRAEEAGYEHVLDNEGKKVSAIVGTAEGGGALHAYLMEIPQEWYDQDMAAQQAEIDKTEEAMKSGTFQGKEGDGRYVPKQGISIKHGR